MAAGFNQSTRFDPERLKELPTRGSKNLLGSSPRAGEQEVRVGQDIYKFEGGGQGGYSYVATIPDDIYEETFGGGQSSGSSEGGSSGGGGGGGARRQGSPMLDPAMNIGPYPFANDYFPVLPQAYQAPAAQDFSAYMPIEIASPFTQGAPAIYGQSSFPGMPTATPNAPVPQNIGGLLYQPYSAEYQQAFLPDNLFNFRPIRMGVGDPNYTRPMSSASVMAVSEGEE